MIHAKDFLTKQKEINGAITDNELKIVDSFERYVDRVIESKYDTFDKAILVESCYFTFKYDPFMKNMTTYSATQRSRMTDELTKRYVDSGWTVSTETHGEGSMNEVDYHVLKPQTQR